MDPQRSLASSPLPRRAAPDDAHSMRAVGRLAQPVGRPSGQMEPSVWVARVSVHGRLSGLLVGHWAIKAASATRTQLFAAPLFWVASLD